MTASVKKLAAVLSAVVGVTIGVSGCSTTSQAQPETGQTATAGANAKGSASTAATAGTGSPAENPPTTSVANRGVDPAVPAPSIAKRPKGASSLVKSRGQAQLSEGAKVLFADGVTVELTAIESATTSQIGPGEIAGEPYTSFTMRVVNGTQRELDLHQVIVEARYDAPARLARPVYLTDTHDLSTAVASGENTSGTYHFSIPNTGKPVLLTVDLDGSHDLARFSGKVTR